MGGSSQEDTRQQDARRDGESDAVFQLAKRAQWLSSRLLGARALQTMDRKAQLQAVVAVVTALLGVVAGLVTIVFAWGASTVYLRIVSVVAIGLFLSFFVVCRLAPQWARAANNLIPAGFVVGCGFGAIYTAGASPISAIYAGAIPLMTMMVCRTGETYFWCGLMAVCLIIGMFGTPPPDFRVPPPWLGHAAGLTFLGLALVGLRVHRDAWDSAVEEARDAYRELRTNHDQQRMLDQRLRSQERAESLALMAGGVAHDFNNFLTVIVGNTSLIRHALEEGEEDSISTLLETIDLAAEDAAYLSRQLLDYTGHRHQTLVLFDAARRFESAVAMAQTSLPVDIELEVDCEQEPVWVEGDPIQFDQVVVNLIRNAAQAYPSRRGRVRASLSACMLDAPQMVATGAEPLPPGLYAKLMVQDFGKGIAPQHMDQLFDPFFTTREVGRGLGLASVHGITLAHGGGVAVESELDVGTTMTLLFPRATAATSAEVDAWTPGGVPVRRDQAVLVADDQPGVREVVRLLLKRHGFKTAVASDGGEALERWRAETFSAIVMDVSMPRVDGVSALAEIRAEDETFPVLMISGYPENLNEQALQRDPYVRVLQKPFSATALRSALTELGVMRQRSD